MPYRYSESMGHFVPRSGICVLWHGNRVFIRELRDNKFWISDIILAPVFCREKVVSSVLNCPLCSGQWSPRAAVGEQRWLSLLWRRNRRNSTSQLSPGQKLRVAWPGLDWWAAVQVMGGDPVILDWSHSQLHSQLTVTNHTSPLDIILIHPAQTNNCSQIEMMLGHWAIFPVLSWRHDPTRNRSFPRMSFPSFWEDRRVSLWESQSWNTNSSLIRVRPGAGCHIDTEQLVDRWRTEGSSYLGTLSPIVSNQSTGLFSSRQQQVF